MVKPSIMGINNGKSLLAFRDLSEERCMPPKLEINIMQHWLKYWQRCLFTSLFWGLHYMRHVKQKNMGIILENIQRNTQYLPLYWISVYKQMYISTNLLLNILQYSIWLTGVKYVHALQNGETTRFCRPWKSCALRTFLSVFPLPNLSLLRWEFCKRS